jgi:hypothetical protein
MTFTEFNRSRSAALQAARQGEEVVVHSARDDEDAVLISRLGARVGALARGIADGTIRAPRRPLDAPFPVAAVGSDRALAALAEFEAERR